MRSYNTFDRPRKRGGCLRNCFSQPTNKSIILLLIWIITIGIIRSTLEATPYFGLSTLYKNQKLLIYVVLGLYIILAVAMMCYPLGGLLGDVYFGRYKIVRASLITMALSMILALVEMVFTLQTDVSKSSHVWKKIVYIVGGGCAFFVLAIGLAGFTSNIVQFGLDQLLEAPSNKLGAFVHLYVWANRVGYTAFDTIYAIKHCYYATPEHTPLNNGLLYGLPVGCFLILLALIILNCFTHQMFNKERVKYNPYKMLFRVLNFACKHKHPVGPRSAFTYCDEFKPSRIDYAKERYGGPFTTSDIEDVKTVMRVFLMLLSLGPIFVITVPTSYYLFATFAIHTTNNVISHGNCSVEWVLLQSGLLSEIVSTFSMPLYTWLLFFVLLKKNMLPKILHRIQLAAIIFCLTPVNMLAVDLTGHVMRTNMEQGNETCMFMQQYMLYDTDIEPLHLHWSVLIFPNLTKTLALDLIMASTFEFISAQSPHTMKGVLVGLLFAVRGFFQLIQAVLLFPFSVIQNNIWSKVAREKPQISCEFSYYLVTIFISFVGLVLFSVGAKKYKYRKREEEPYSQSRVEEIYDRMLREREQRQIAGRINDMHRINDID